VPPAPAPGHTRPPPICSLRTWTVPHGDFTTLRAHTHTHHCCCRAATYCFCSAVTTPPPCARTVLRCGPQRSITHALRTAFGLDVKTRLTTDIVPCARTERDVSFAYAEARAARHRRGTHFAPLRAHACSPGFLHYLWHFFPCIYRGSLLCLPAAGWTLYFSFYVSLLPTWLLPYSVPLSIAAILLYACLFFSLLALELGSAGRQDAEWISGWMTWRCAGLVAMPCGGWARGGHVRLLLRVCCHTVRPTPPPPRRDVLRHRATNPCGTLLRGTHMHYAA